MYLPVANQLLENIANRKQFFDEQNISGMQIAVANLVHGTAVAIVTPTSEYILPETDALVTKESNIVLTLTGADCFPAYCEEREAGIIGLAHCGWRGIVDGIIVETIVAIKKQGGKVENIIITIGPGICAKHFEVQNDILPVFDLFSQFVSHDDGIRVDLRGIMKKQIQELGIPSGNVFDNGECTYCLPEKYFSYRRDKSNPLETQVAYIVQSPHRKFKK